MKHLKAAAAAALVCILCAVPRIKAEDTVSVSGFTSIPLTTAEGGGRYSMYGTSSYVGSTFLNGSGYTLSDGVINATASVPLTLSEAHVYPNPCSVKEGCLSVKFTKVTIKAVVKIYTVSGELVREFDKNSNDDFITWDLTNARGSRVSSGLYVYYAKTGGSSKKGKIIVIR